MRVSSTHTLEEDITLCALSDVTVSLVVYKFPEKFQGYKIKKINYNKIDWSYFEFIYEKNKIFEFINLLKIVRKYYWSWF